MLLRPTLTFVLLEIGTYVYHRGVHQMRAPFHIDHHQHTSSQLANDVASYTTAMVWLPISQFIWRSFYPPLQVCPTSYVIYITLVALGHRLNHVCTWNVQPFVHYRKWHALHHANPSCNFGAFTPFVDMLFGTYIRVDV